MDGIKALAFDTGGTLPDGRSGIVRVLTSARTRRTSEHGGRALGAGGSASLEEAL